MKRFTLLLLFLLLCCAPIGGCSFYRTEGLHRPTHTQRHVQKASAKHRHQRERQRVNYRRGWYYPTPKGQRPTLF